jgi:transketolase
MLRFNERTMKMWSRIGSRAAFGLAAAELAKDHEDLVVLTADVSTSAGLDRLRKTCPDKFIDVGIAEQNMMGIAAGLASEDLRVVTATFAPFQTMRCCEQLRVNLGYMGQKVCMVGLASGVALGPLGFTHCCIEDMAILRGIPGITVISPADCGETVKAVAAALEHPESVYIRLTGGNLNPMVYTSDYSFEVGRAVPLRDGADVTLFATGSMVHPTLRAADILEESGISAAVVNMHTIKPLDADAVRHACETTGLIATVEEHNVFGGLGGAVAEVKTTLEGAPPQLLLGIPDTYGKCASYEDLLARHGLTPQGIADDVAAAYAKLESRPTKEDGHAGSRGVFRAGRGAQGIQNPACLSG